MSLADVVNGARQAGFNGQGLLMAVAVSLGENGSSNPRATNSAGNSAGIDRGLWQINSFYHPEVSDACAFDPACAAKAAYRISNGGSNWNAWSTFKNGAAQSKIGQAAAAIAGIASGPLIPGTGIPIPGGAPGGAITGLDPGSAISAATAGVSAGLSAGVTQLLQGAQVGAGVLLLLAGLALLALTAAGKSETLRTAAKDAVTVAAVIPK